MSDEHPAGPDRPQGAGRRRRQRPVDRLWLRQGVPHRRRRPRHHLAEREGPAARRAAGAGARCADHRRRSTSPSPGQLEAVFDAIRTQWGRLDILVHSIAFAPQGGPAGRAARLLGRGLRQGDGRLLPFLRPHGEAGRAADDRRRHDVRDELLRRQPRGAELQRDGAGEGGARGGLPLSRL